MTGEMDPGCRGAFPWEATRWDLGLLETARMLIALRHATPAFRDTDFAKLAADGMAVAYRRGNGGGSAIVAINAGDTPAELAIPASADASLVAIPGLPAATLAPGDDGTLRIALPARSGAVVCAG
jgi:glycosidase